VEFLRQLPRQPGRCPRAAGCARDDSKTARHMQQERPRKKHYSYFFDHNASYFFVHYSTSNKIPLQLNYLLKKTIPYPAPVKDNMDNDKGDHKQAVILMDEEYQAHADKIPMEHQGQAAGRLDDKDQKQNGIDYFEPFVLIHNAIIVFSIE
jgi:hypothetical protein